MNCIDISETNSSWLNISISVHEFAVTPYIFTSLQIIRH